MKVYTWTFSLLESDPQVTTSPHSVHYTCQFIATDVAQARQQAYQQDQIHEIKDVSGVFGLVHYMVQDLEGQYLYYPLGHKIGILRVPNHYGSYPDQEIPIHADLKWYFEHTEPEVKEIQILTKWMVPTE